MREQVVSMVLEVSDQLNTMLDEKLSIEDGEACKLYGVEGVLDSMSLVSLVVGVEEAVEDQYDVSVIIADEKAMSKRSSPFLSVATLADYVVQLIQKEQLSVEGVRL